MAELECSSKIQEKLSERFSAFSFHSTSDGCYIEMPFKDASGDFLTVRVKKDGTAYTVDDGGYISHLTAYVQPEKSAIRQMNDALSSYSEFFGAALNKNEGTIEISCEEGQLADKVFRLVQLMISLDTTLSMIAMKV